MAENKNLVEDALIQMKNLEEAVAENAKGILASTMKEEIKELVKESLSEQDEDEVETDVEMDLTGDEDGDDDSEVEMDMEMDMDTDDEDETMDVDMDMDMDTDMDDETIDLTGASDEEVLKVFKAMGEDDGIIIKKDGDSIHLTDDNADVEYMVKLGESTDEKYSMDEEMEEDMYEDAINDVFGSEMDEDMDMENIKHKMFSKDEEDEVVYEVEMDEESMEMDEMWGGNKHDYKRRDGHKMGDVDGHYKDYEGEEDEEVVYEIEMDEESQEEEESWSMDEAFMSKPVIGKGGVIGKGAANIGWKQMKPVNKKAFQDDMKYSVPTKGKTGPASHTKKVTNPGKGSIHGLYHKTETVKNKDLNKANISDAIKGEMGAFGEFGKMVSGAKFQNKIKKAETKEASRTLGNGSDFRKGGLPKPKAHSAFNANINEEVETLRAKNEEYRKALNIFRSKLNEVAVFNSNLAYATRLFTEHTTTKQEKINILRRFDDAQTIKESKNLYQSIKNELSKENTKMVTESIENKIDKSQSTGSSVNLIESRTYENPQFLRMKDLMGKLK